MEQQLFIVDADGFLVDVVTSDMVFQLDEGFRVVKKPWPDGMRKPKHDEATDEWVNGETPEEKAAREAQENAPKPPTELDIVGQQLVERELENLELRAQNDVLGQQLVAIDLRLLQGGM